MPRRSSRNSRGKPPPEEEPEEEIISEMEPARPLRVVLRLSSEGKGAKKWTVGAEREEDDEQEEEGAYEEDGAEVAADGEYGEEEQFEDEEQGEEALDDDDEFSLGGKPRRKSTGSAEKPKRGVEVQSNRNKSQPESPAGGIRASSRTTSRVARDRTALMRLQEEEADAQEAAELAAMKKARKGREQLIRQQLRQIELQKKEIEQLEKAKQKQKGKAKGKTPTPTKKVKDADENESEYGSEVSQRAASERPRRKSARAASLAMAEWEDTAHKLEEEESASTAKKATPKKQSKGKRTPEKAAASINDDTKTKKSATTIKLRLPLKPKDATRESLDFPSDQTEIKDRARRQKASPSRSEATPPLTSSASKKRKATEVEQNTSSSTSTSAAEETSTKRHKARSASAKSTETLVSGTSNLVPESPDIDSTASTKGSQPKTPQKEKKLALNKVLSLLLTKFIRKDEYGIFYDPVPDDVPHYREIIKRPMAFTDMKKKLDEGKYTSPAPFQADLKLICDNCVTFNDADTIYYQEAVKLRKYAEEQYKTWLPKIDPNTIGVVAKKGKEEDAQERKRPRRESSKKKLEDEIDNPETQPKKKRRTSKDQSPAPTTGKRRKSEKDALDATTPDKSGEKKSETTRKRKSAGAVPSSPSLSSDTDAGLLSPTPTRRRGGPGRPRGPRRKSEAAEATPVESRTMPPPSPAPRTVSARATSPVFEAAPTMPTGPKPVTHSARYLAWKAARQQTSPSVPAPQPVSAQSLLSSLSSSDVHLISKHLRVLRNPDEPRSWPTLATEAASPIAEGAQGVLEDNVAPLNQLLLSQYEGMTLATVARAASVAGGLTALVAHVPPKMLLPSTQTYHHNHHHQHQKERSRILSPLLPLGATGRALNPLAPPSSTFSSGSSAQGYTTSQQHRYQSASAYVPPYQHQAA